MALSRVFDGESVLAGYLILENPAHWSRQGAEILPHLAFRLGPPGDNPPYQLPVKWERQMREFGSHSNPGLLAARKAGRLYPNGALFGATKPSLTAC
jgi:hypothetical protein